MSVCYGGYYDVRLRVKKGDLETIRQVVNTVRGGYQEENTPWAYAHNNISTRFIDEIDRAYDETTESVVLDIYCDVDDCTHGFYGQYMDPIQKAVPNIEIAVEVYFSNCGDENDEDFCFDPEEDIFVRGYGYKGPNDAPLRFDECGDLFFDPSGIWIFPKDADWIPWSKKEE